MTNGNRPVKAALIICVLFFLIGGPLVANELSKDRAAQDIKNVITGCQRTNAIRIAEFSNAVLDAGTREAAAEQYTDDAKDTILEYAALNWDQAQSVIDAAHDYPLENWAITPRLRIVESLAQKNLADPGSPAVDCEQAF